MPSFKAKVMSRLGLLGFISRKKKMRVNGNPLLLELHHFVRALPPFLAAAHTAASHGVRSSWGAVQLVSPLRAWCPLGASS